MYLILYNPISRNGANIEVVTKLVKKMRKKHENVESLSLLEIEDPKSFIETLDNDTKIILVGGDGTLNRIANQVIGIEKLPEVYLYKAGTGNDFRRSIKERGKIVRIDQYLTNLPQSEFENKKVAFLNGVGLGFDGYVCYLVEGSKNNKTKLNFFVNVFKALKSFKPSDFEVEVDGVNKQYKKAWFVTIMNSKYLGGGMKMAPKAKRENQDLHVIIVHGVTKAKIFTLFPLIYLGWHTKIRGVELLRGNKIKVKAATPAYVQVDGEVYANQVDVLIEK